MKRGLGAVGGGGANGGCRLYVGGRGNEPMWGGWKVVRSVRLSGGLSVGLSGSLSVEVTVGVVGEEWLVGVDLEVSWVLSSVSIDESGKKGRSSCVVRGALEARGGVGAAPPT